MTDDGSPSWDAKRAAAPPRPAFASSLPDEELIDRPRRALVAFGFAVLAAAGWATMAAIAVSDLDGIRQALVAALPEDLRDTYDEADQERAATVMLALAGVLGAALAVMQLLAMRSVVFARSRGSRLGFTIFVALLLPVTLLAAALASADILLAGAAIGCAVLAALISWTPKSSRWLRQGGPRRTIPIADPRS